MRESVEAAISSEDLEELPWNDIKEKVLQFTWFNLSSIVKMIKRYKNQLNLITYASKFLHTVEHW